MSRRRVEIPRRGVPVTTARDVAEDPALGSRFTLSADVVVVGSGAGGSVVAHELAAEGHDVLVLESGRYYPSEDFTEHLGDTLEQVYKDQGSQLNNTADVLFVEGACIGGSTVIGACVMHRPPDSLLREWPEKHGLDQLSPEKLAPLFDEIGEEQYVHLNESHEINSTARKVIEGCEHMGFRWRPVTRNVRRCALTGHCLSGCKPDRKMSALVTHLPWAVGHGARLFADTHVTRVRIDNNRVQGVEALVRDPDTGDVVSEVRVDAQVVVSAAGAIQSPLLLQRSQIPDFSGQVGKNLAVQPFTQVLARYPEELFGFRGALVGVQVDEFLESDGFLFYSALAEPEQLLAQGDQGVGEDHIRFMMGYKHMAGLNAFALDDGRGSVTWDGDARGGRQIISWNPSRAEFNRMKRCTSLAARIFFSSGAQRVYLPTYQRLEVDSVFDLDAAMDEIKYGVRGLYTFRSNSFSPQGTCRMGRERSRAVVNQNGEVFDVAGLFVADASLFPQPMPAAPHWTVQVLAKHVARRIHARRASLFV